MKSSDSEPSKASAQERMSARYSSSDPVRRLPLWLTENAEFKLFVLYAATVMLMLVIYFLDPPVERWEFYRHSMAAWRAWFGS